MFKIPFELASQEEVQEMIRFLNESFSSHSFPYVDVKYVMMNYILLKE